MVTLSHFLIFCDVIARKGAGKVNHGNMKELIHTLLTFSILGGGAQMSISIRRYIGLSHNVAYSRHVLSEDSCYHAAQKLNLSGLCPYP